MLRLRVAELRFRWPLSPGANSPTLPDDLQLLVVGAEAETHFLESPAPYWHPLLRLYVTSPRLTVGWFR
jgi:hypothetical protein